MTAAKQSASAIVGADGTARITFSPTRGQNWIVKQLSVRAPNVGGGAVGEFFINSDSLGPFVPQSDSVAGEPFVPVNNGEKFSARWSGCTVGAQVNATILYDDGN